MTENNNSIQLKIAIYGGIFFTAMSVLLFQVALTRIFAILMWHHFAYMIISLALLGFGASGSYLTVSRLSEKREGMSGRLALYTTLYGVSILLAFFLVTRIQINSLEIWVQPSNLLGLFGIFLLLSIPFFFGGLSIGLVLTVHSDRVGRLYFSDLVGSALGGACAPLLLDQFGSTGTIMWAATIALFGGAIFAIPCDIRRRVGHGLPVFAGAILVYGFSFGLFTWEVPFAPNKGFLALFQEDRKSETVLHSSVAQVDVSPPIQHEMLMGGQFGEDGGRVVVAQRGVTQDGTAPTNLYENAADFEKYTALEATQAASAFHALRARGQTPSNVLVIGVGGGIDVMMSLYYGAQKITAVEINKAMIRMVTEDYADYIGNLFDDQRVKLINEEGRSFAHRTNDRFDVIQMSGVDTYTALSTGAYTLSESYLYTTEAVRDMYRILNEDGIINYSRFLLIPPRQPRETIRLANIARHALELEGVEEPWRHIVVLQAYGWASTMIRKNPFTKAEVDYLRKFSERQNFMGLVYEPIRPRGGPYTEMSQSMMSTRLAKGFMASLQSVLPNYSVPDGSGQVEDVLRSAIAARLTADETLFRKELARFEALHTHLSPEGREGLAGLLASVDVQIDHFSGNAQEFFTQTQKDFEVLIRGSEEERQALISDYTYDLSPSSDDRPFFFDYFKLSKFDRYSFTSRWATEYHSDFPVGHLVLISSLLQITVLAAVMILYPLRKLKNDGIPTPGRWRFFAYFAALGVGFMFLEISLMQKFILFLGNPTYSLSVVLSGLLAFSGFGALASTWVQKPTRSFMRKLAAAIFVVTLFDAFVLEYVLSMFLGESIAVRILITLILLAPTGFLLGFPFPIGVRLVEAHAKVLIPWAWAVNGFLSVFSSMMAIVVAMGTGFSGVMVLVGFIYVAGFLLVPTEAVETAESA